MDGVKNNNYPGRLLFVNGKQDELLLKTVRWDLNH